MIAKRKYTRPNLRSSAIIRGGRVPQARPSWLSGAGCGEISALELQSCQVNELYFGPGHATKPRVKRCLMKLPKDRDLGRTYASANCVVHHSKFRAQ